MQHALDLEIDQALNLEFADSQILLSGLGPACRLKKWLTSKWMTLNSESHPLGFQTSRATTLGH